jgi:hypothetical protein
MIDDAYNMMGSAAVASYREFQHRVQTAKELIQRDLERAKASHEQLMKTKGFVTKSRAWIARATQYGGPVVLGALGAAAGYGLASQTPEMIEAFGIK